MNKDNFEDSCCWNEEDDCAYGFERISPTRKQCLGCYEKFNDEEWSVENA